MLEVISYLQSLWNQLVSHKLLITQWSDFGYCGEMSGLGGAWNADFQAWEGRTATFDQGMDPKVIRE